MTTNRQQSRRAVFSADTAALSWDQSIRGTILLNRSRIHVLQV